MDIPDKTKPKGLAIVMAEKMKPKGDEPLMADDDKMGADEPMPDAPSPDEVDAAHDLASALGMPHVDASELAMALKNWASVCAPDDQPSADPMGAADEPMPGE